MFLVFCFGGFHKKKKLIQPPKTQNSIALCWPADGDVELVRLEHAQQYPEQQQGEGRLVWGGRGQGRAESERYTPAGTTPFRLLVEAEASSAFLRRAGF